MKKKKRKKKIPTRTKLVWFCVVMITLYTIAAVWLQFVTQVEVSTTLTTCFYGFFSIELWNISRITINRTKNGYYSKTDIVNNDNENDEI